MLMPVHRQALIRYTQSAKRSHMKKQLFLFLTICTLNAYSQDTLSLHQTKFNQIQSIDYSLTAGTYTAIYNDDAFNYFINQKTKVLLFLIGKIADTTFTVIERKTTNGFYKKGDLAIILLSSIKTIPYYSITGYQWCTCCETGSIPVDFFSYLDKNRLDFQSKCRRYFLEPKQEKALKKNKKNRKD